MEKFDIYNDISTRTQGDIYIGVVGPVRTGKSTFITKFMENFVVPNISNKLQKQIAKDDMPQSADGKTIMTTQPKFVPANSVKIQFNNKVTANVRLVDCVGYMVNGASGNIEDNRERMVKTPWKDEEMPFDEAAEYGTNKVISDYSTIGIMVTTDGSFSDIERENYVEAEEKVVNEIKKCGKPFVIILNTKEPKSDKSLKLATELMEKYDVSVVSENILTLDSEKISKIMENILMEFPMCGVNIDLPKWIEALPSENDLVCEIVEEVKKNTVNVTKMKDYYKIENMFNESEHFNKAVLNEIELGCGFSDYSITAKNDLFYSILSKESGEEICDEFDLMSCIKDFSNSNKKFCKIKEALSEAENNGYGVVVPSIDETSLCEPTLIKQNGKYGVKIRATAPCLHIMKVDVATELSPLVGSKQQGEEMVNYINGKYDENPNGIWDTNMFGKSLYDIVNDGLKDKVLSMQNDTKDKMRKTVTKIVNENHGGVICILL